MSADTGRVSNWTTDETGWDPRRRRRLPVDDTYALDCLSSVAFEDIKNLVRKHLKRDYWEVSRVARTAAPASLGTDRLFVATISNSMEKAISSSKAILDLEVDLDAGITVRYTEATWRRATGLLRQLSDLYWQAQGEFLPPPSIGAATEGSIDLFWENDEAGLSLLINIPSDSAQGTTFFGRRFATGKISGIIDSADEEPSYLAAWLSGRA